MDTAAGHTTWEDVKARRRTEPGTGHADQDLVDITWLTTVHGRRLHHATVEVPFDVTTETTTACGRRLTVMVPGIFTRTGAQRCRRCCEATGMPDGTGSPKNDPRCRALLGLDG